jgi:hypothetical protein
MVCRFAHHPTSASSLLSCGSPYASTQTATARLSARSPAAVSPDSTSPRAHFIAFSSSGRGCALILPNRPFVCWFGPAVK